MLYDLIAFKEAHRLWSKRIEEGIAATMRQHQKECEDLLNRFKEEFKIMPKPLTPINLPLTSEQFEKAHKRSIEDTVNALNTPEAKAALEEMFGANMYADLVKLSQTELDEINTSAIIQNDRKK